MSDGMFLLSNVVRIDVRPPVSRADHAVAELASGEEQGVLMSLVGSDAPELRRGNEALRTIVERYPEHPVASVARLVHATNAAREFKAIQIDGSVNVREARTQEAAAILHRAPGLEALLRAAVLQRRGVVAARGRRAADTRAVRRDLRSRAASLHTQPDQGDRIYRAAGSCEHAAGARAKWPATSCRTRSAARLPRRFYRNLTSTPLHQPSIKGASMSDSQESMPPDRTPDRIAVDLKMASSGVPDGYASFKGYLAAEHDGLQRLYSDDTFQRWIAVAASDIVGRINVPPNETDARSVVYIRREAKVIACHVSYAHEVEVEVEVEDKSFESAASGLPGHPPWRS